MGTIPVPHLRSVRWAIDHAGDGAAIATGPGLEHDPVGTYNGWPLGPRPRT
ncbi:hypothetical protein ACRBEV_06885 [Methylobacterium phyllosphaerae]